MEKIHIPVSADSVHSIENDANVNIVVEKGTHAVLVLHVSAKEVQIVVQVLSDANLTVVCVQEISGSICTSLASLYEMFLYTTTSVLGSLSSGYLLGKATGWR